MWRNIHWLPGGGGGWGRGELGGMAQDKISDGFTVHLPPIEQRVQGADGGFTKGGGGAIGSPLRSPSDPPKIPVWVYCEYDSLT